MMAAIDILDFQNFDFRRSERSRGGTASLSQILSKSLQPWPKYRDFSIFQNGGCRRLGFSKFEMFNCENGQEGRSA